MLKEVIGASMRAFWEFLRADKDEVHAMTLMGIHGHHVELQDPLDAELLIEIRSNLQKVCHSCCISLCTHILCANI